MSLGEIEVFFNLPKHIFHVGKVRPVAGPRRRLPGDPAGLLVGDPRAFGLGSTDQESCCGEKQQRRPENVLRAAVTSAFVPRVVVPGSTRGSSVLAGCVRVQVWCPQLRSGGDEETRTPDPLLAKEMLCQLSYVPGSHVTRQAVGGRFWTRTRDLCLIRAVL